MLGFLKNLFRGKASSVRHSSPVEVQQACDPDTILAIIGVVPETEPDPPMDGQEFVTRVFMQTNPGLFSALSKSKAVDNLKIHYLACSGFDPNSGILSPDAWSPLIDHLGYSQNCLLYIQSLILQNNTRPKYISLFTLCKSNEPLNIVIEGAIGPK